MPIGEDQDNPTLDDEANTCTYIIQANSRTRVIKASAEETQTYDYHAFDCGHPMLQGSMCAARHVNIQVIAGANVTCDFSVNVPGKNIFNDTHNPPLRVRQIDLSYDHGRVNQNPLILAYKIGEECFTKRKVEVTCYGKNKFSFKYKKNYGIGFMMFATTVIQWRNVYPHHYKKYFKYSQYFNSELRD